MSIRATHLAAVAALAAALWTQPASAQRVVRSVRPVVSSTQSSLATLVVQPPVGATSVEVIETIPLGWSAMEISGGGVFDAEVGEIAWFKAVDNPSAPAEFALTYRLLAQGGASGHYDLEGGAIFRDGVGEETETSALGDVAVVGESAPLSFATRSIVGARVIEGGAVVSVSLSVQPTVGMEFVGVEEQLPLGWNVTQIAGGGIWNRDVDGSSTIRWGVFDRPTVAAMTFAYDVQVPVDAPEGQFNFVGADGANFDMGGYATRPVGDQRAFIRGDRAAVYAFLGQLDLDGDEASGHDINGVPGLESGDAVAIVNAGNAR